jgi:hypothetical protein
VSGSLCHRRAVATQGHTAVDLDRAGFTADVLESWTHWTGGERSWRDRAAKKRRAGDMAATTQGPGTLDPDALVARAEADLRSRPHTKTEWARHPRP